jgi:hypothetical protein
VVRKTGRAVKFLRRVPYLTLEVGRSVRVVGNGCYLADIPETDTKVVKL